MDVKQIADNFLNGSNGYQKNVRYAMTYYERIGLVDKAVLIAEENDISGNSISDLDIDKKLYEIGESYFLGSNGYETDFLYAEYYSKASGQMLDILKIQSLLNKYITQRENEEFVFIKTSLYEKNGASLLKYNRKSNGKETVEIPDIFENRKVTIIDESAFAEDTFLRNVIVPDSVIHIKRSAFQNCINLESVILSSRLEIIGIQAFNECHKLKQIFVPNSVINIGRFCFSSCRNLNVVHLSKNLQRISNGLFDDCYKLESINIPQSVESIGTGSFNGCNRLKKVLIPHNVKNIDLNAFTNCKKIEIILTNIDRRKFQKIHDDLSKAPVITEISMVEYENEVKKNEKEIIYKFNAENDRIRNYGDDRIVTEIVDLEPIPKIIDKFTVTASNENWTITSNQFPSEWEPKIQEAVQLKRTGRYIESIKKYIDLMENTKTIYSGIMYFLYKVVACSGYLIDAYLILNNGQRAYRVKNNKLDSLGDTSGFIEHLEKLKTALRSENALKKYLTSISGNPNYKLPRSYLVIRQEIESIGKKI
jgi:hypothetical protein